MNARNFWEISELIDTVCLWWLFLSSSSSQISLPVFTPLRPIHILYIGWGAPVEISDASLTTSINHSPSNYLSPAPFCLSLYVSVSISLCLAYTTLISVSSLFPTHDMGTTYHKNTYKGWCCQEQFIYRVCLGCYCSHYHWLTIVGSVHNHKSSYFFCPQLNSLQKSLYSAVLVI